MINKTRAVRLRKAYGWVSVVACGYQVANGFEADTVTLMILYWLCAVYLGFNAWSCLRGRRT